MQENKCQSTSLPDDSPIAQWYQLHAIPLLTYIRQHVPSREDAEDIVVEAFIAALEQKGFSPYTLTEQEQLAWYGGSPIINASTCTDVRHIDRPFI